MRTMLESPLDAQQRPRTICRFFTLLCELSNLNTQCDIKDAQGKKTSLATCALAFVTRVQVQRGAAQWASGDAKDSRMMVSQRGDGFRNYGIPTDDSCKLEILLTSPRELRHPDCRL